MLVRIIFWTCGFIIFWAMIGYPIALNLLGRLYWNRPIKKDYEKQPTVTVMVVAHNEEKVILKKLNNLMELDYPEDKIKFLVASDNSTDATNNIVKEFIAEHPDKNIQLYEVKARKGKTNAQNEAQKLVTTEYLVMSDANSMLDKNAVKELMAVFTSDDIAYVSGRLDLTNADSSDVSNAEKKYWEGDLISREIEAKMQTITAGNGALYACRNDEYIDFEPIECHDSAMPIYFALQGKRAIVNHEAIAFEKAGEAFEDEFNRKVRMNRMILKHILPDIRILNIFKYRWFSFFYFGHRTCRYLLWIAHLLLLIMNTILAMTSAIYLVLLIFHVGVYFCALLKHCLKISNKYITFVYYYVITIIAQWVGVYRILTGKAKPFWEKAESTR